MFKGLKSKLEDEAKKLQATVSQYSENIAQQVRSGVSDAGSDASGHVRRLFGSGTVRNSPPLSPNPFGDDETGYNFDAGQLSEQNPNRSAMMQEIPEQDLFGEPRERRNSGGSVGSNESSFSNLFSSIPGMLSSAQRLSTIPSDVESESLATSSQFQSASKEQISTVLHKLQGRAANYKDKYRGLVKMYNELVRENEKYRSVLTATQDKALDRIDKLRQKNRQLLEKIKELECDRDSNIAKVGTELEEGNKVKKLQELLEKCRMNMRENKEKIRQLIEENEKLKKNIEATTDEQGISDLAVQRVTAEWKGRMDCLEEEWSKRLHDSEEAGTLAIAKVKAEMHGALEEKENELQAARAKCKMLETNGSDVQRQIDELKATVDALESEKADMVEKLKEAKQQGVKAVRCEEEEKREELKKEMERKRAMEREEDERRFQEMIKKNQAHLQDEQWALKFKEHEEQTQLAIEEREMQKVAAVMEHDRRNDDLGVQVEQLNAEKLHLKSVLDDMKERHRRQMEELSSSIETNKERHQQEIALLKKKQEETITMLKKDLEKAAESNKQLNEQLHEVKNSNQKIVEGVEKRNNELINELAKERQTVDDLKKHYENELNALNAKICSLEEDHEKTVKEKDILWGELTQRNTELGELKQQLCDLNESISNKKKEMEELHGILEQKTATIMSLESEKEFLSAELASTRELSKIHQHLQDQLKTAQMERDEAEKRYSEMEERVQKAVQELEEDRRVLQQAKQELEEKKSGSLRQESELTETEVSKSEADEMKCKMIEAQEQAQKARDDLSEKVASLIAESEELKNRVESQQEQIEKLEDEKRSLVKELKSVRDEFSKQQFEIKRADESNGALNNDLLKMMEELDSLKVEKDDLTKKLQKMQEETEKELNDKFMFIEDLKSQNELLKAESEAKQKQLEMATAEKAAVDATPKEETESERRVDIEQQDLLRLEDVALEDSGCSGAEKLIVPTAADFAEKVAELQNKLHLVESERLSLLTKIEMLERHMLENDEEKKNMMEELEDIRGSRDNLKIRMEEVEESVRETFAKNGSEMKRLKKELGDRIDEVANLRSEAAAAENEINEKSSKITELIAKIEELEAVNENLRIEFLQKEGIVSELQKRMEEESSKENAEVEKLKGSLEREQKRGADLKNELTETKKSLEKTRNELQEKRNNEELLETELAERRRKEEEEQNIRDQYALALKNANDNLEEAQKQLAELDLVRIEKERLVAELSLAKEDCQKVVQQSKQENAQQIEEIKKKAEQKVLKMKKQYETDGQAAKAELLLQIDDMRSKIADRDLQIEEQKLNISLLEQKLLDEGQNGRIISDLRASIQAATDERDSKSNRCAELEAQLDAMRTAAQDTKKQLESQSQQIETLQNELDQLKMRNAELQENVQAAEVMAKDRRALLDEKLKLEKDVEKLQLEIADWKKTANEESVKASAKAESERQRLLRDLQKEIKQLYHDLNERTQQLDETQARLQELTNKKTENHQALDGDTQPESNEPAERLRTESEIAEHTDYEELCALRERVAEYEKQLENTKEAHKKEVALLCEKVSSAEKSNVIGLESLTNGVVTVDKDFVNDNTAAFAEPTEAEYLRNVLYRYMNERETLGKESVTLARVIATVARFTREQVNAVVAKEEQRNYGWVGDSDGTLVVQPVNPVLNCLKRRPLMRR